MEKKISILIIYSIINLLFIFKGFSQEIPPLENAQNIYEHDAQFRKWLSENPNQKSWKWMARYENDLIKRVDSEGKMPTNEQFLAAYNQVQSFQQQDIESRGASNWSPVGPYGNTNLIGIGRVNCIAFHPKDSATFFVGFGQGGIWKTTNGGQNFIPLGDNLPILRISAIAIDPINPDIMYISLSDFAYIGYDLYTADRKRNTYYGMGVWKSTDGGKTWNLTGLKNKLDEGINSITKTIWINPKNTKELVTCGTKGVLKSTDSGDSWKITLPKMSSQIIQDPSNSDILLAAGIYINTVKIGEAGIWRSEDAGNTWKLLNSGIGAKIVQRTEMAFSPSNPKQVYAVSCNLNNNFEGLYKSNDGGVNWEKSSFKGNVLSGSLDGTYGQGFYDLCIIVHPTNSNRVFVGGIILSESNDSGNNWKLTTARDIHVDHHFLAYNPLNKTTYLCNDGGVYSTKEVNLFKEGTWKFISNGINATSCYRLGVSEDGGQVLTGAQDNGTYLAQISGQKWYSVYGGDGMECAMVNNWAYISYQFGNIAFYNTKVNNTKEQYLFPPANNQDGGEWTTPYIINKEANLVTIAGGNIYRARIGEDITKLIRISGFPKRTSEPYPTVSTALAVPNSDTKTIYIAKKQSPILKIDAQILKTTNAGATWTQVADNGLFKDSYITYLSVDDKNANRVWACMSNFVEGKKVIYSQNGGKTWENISYNLPNLPANCVVYQNEPTGADILYVAMDIGVYYMIEGTKEWKPLMQNLPNVIVHELEINYKTNKLYAATFGRGVWITDLVKEALPAADIDFYATPITLYPNPTQGDIFVKTDFTNIERIEVIDTTGRLIYKENLDAKVLRYGKKIGLDLNHKGLFYLKLVNGAQTRALPFVRI